MASFGLKQGQYLARENQLILSCLGRRGRHTTDRNSQEYLPTTRVLSRVSEGQKLPPQNAQLPPKKINIVVITVLSNYIVTAGHCTHCNTSQNCLKMHQIASQHIIISKIPSRGHAPGRKLMAFGHSGLLPQTIDLRQNPATTTTTTLRGEF